MTRLAPASGVRRTTGAGRRRRSTPRSPTRSRRPTSPRPVRPSIAPRGSSATTSRSCRSTTAPAGR
jgi:hypothetical protein